MPDLLVAIILGVVEGVTEFLPISSTGHLVLCERWLGIDLEHDAFWKMFTVFIQIGAIASVVVYFRDRITSLLRGRKLPGTVVEQLETIMAEGTTDTFLLLQHSPAVGKTLGDLGLGQEGDCALIAVVRGGRAMERYDDSFVLRVGDTLVMTGNHASMDRLFQRLRPREPEAAEEASR